MARTTVAAVEGIIENSDNITLTPFIEAANALVTQCCGSSTTYTEDNLELIERWVTAHLFTVRDPRTTQERTMQVAGTFQSKVDLGFDSSHYGQMAMRLDWEGGLASLNKSAKQGGLRTVGIVWTGVPVAEINDIVEELG